MNTRYTTFDEIIKSVLNEEELDVRAYARLIDIVVRGYHEIFRTASADVKTVLLSFDNPQLRIINYPVDYDYYTKVGMIVCTYNGTPRLVTLSLNDRIHKWTDGEIAQTACDCESLCCAQDTDLVVQGYTPWSAMYLFRNVMRGNQIVGELYGLGGGESYKGSFNYDDLNSRFVLSTEVATDATIVLEYKPNPLHSRGSTRINVKCREALIAWVKWRMLNRKNSSISEREEARINYLNAHEALSWEEDQRTASELYDHIYSHSSFIKYG